MKTLQPSRRWGRLSSVLPALGLVACASTESPREVAEDDFVSTGQIDGAYTPVQGTEVTIVFRLRAKERGPSLFFAEYPLPGGDVRRVRGTFEHGFGNGGHEVTLRPDQPDESIDRSAPLLSGTFHYVKTGANGTVIVRGPTGKTVQLRRIPSYCGVEGAADCAFETQRLGGCESGWTCSAQHTCVCPDHG